MTPGGGGGLWTRRLTGIEDPAPMTPVGAVPPHPRAAKGRPYEGRAESSRPADGDPEPIRTSAPAKGTGPRAGLGPAPTEWHAGSSAPHTSGQPHGAAPTIGTDARADIIRPCIWGQSAWRVTTSARAKHGPSGAPGRSPGQLHPGPRAAAVRRLASNSPGDLLWGLRPHSP